MRFSTLIVSVIASVAVAAPLPGDVDEVPVDQVARRQCSSLRYHG
jgi:hypothetical protein